MQLVEKLSSSCVPQESQKVEHPWLRRFGSKHMVDFFDGQNVLFEMLGGLVTIKRDNLVVIANFRNEYEHLSRR